MSSRDTTTRTVCFDAAARSLLACSRGYCLAPSYVVAFCVNAQRPDWMSLSCPILGNTRFDASQYAFFGNDVMEEVELGGLEDNENEDIVFVGIDDDNIQSSSLEDREEGHDLGSFSDIDDLTTTFSKLNKNVNGPRNVGIIGDRSISRESSSAADWSLEADSSNWVDQRVLDAENVRDGKHWWSQPQCSSARIVESKRLYRTSSYPKQQQQQHGHSEPIPMLDKPLSRTSSYPQPQQHGPSEPIAVPKSSFTSYPPPGSLQASPNQSHHFPSLSFGSQLPFSAPNLFPFSGSQLHLGGPTPGLPYGGNMAQFTPPGLSPSSLPCSQLNNSNIYPGDHLNLMPNLLQQQLPHPRSLMTSQLFLHHPQQRIHPVQPSLSHLSHLQPQIFDPHPSPQIFNKYEAMLGMVDLRDQRLKPATWGKQGIGILQEYSDASKQRSDNGWPQFRSKYMSAEEIANILRMQHCATHSSDPYIDDYYHQACLAKKSAGLRLKHHFCPTFIRELSSHSRGNNEPHAFLQVDALGRVSFSSIRRPRPLLEVDPSTSVDNILDQKSSVKPLEQEPMLAARITIEDGLCLLLDIDDIDRLLQFSQPQDGGSQLRRRRQVLLEGLAASLQLVDPLGPGKTTGHDVGLSPNDDLVFLRIVSLPKGRKLLSRYLNLIFPANELTRIVCMAIFRHLRFLFGVLPSDISAAEATVILARSVSSCVSSMDLSAMSACLAAVVCSTEQPPLRPLGNSSGDGASIIIKSVLEKATKLLTGPHAASNYSMSNRSLWQASFNAFFALLIRYCMSKYDSVMQSLVLQAPYNVTTESDVAKSISREMPVEILRASLPHTNECQRKVLVDFAQRSTKPVTAFSVHGNGSGQMNSESLPC